MTAATVVMPSIILFIACACAGTLKENFEVIYGGGTVDPGKALKQHAEMSVCVSSECSFGCLSELTRLCTDKACHSTLEKHEQEDRKELVTPAPNKATGARF